jgi:hypothetical protein
MGIEWNSVATSLIKGLEFYIRGLEVVDHAANQDSARKHPYDVPDALRQNQVRWDERLVRSSATHLLLSVVPTHLCACYRLMSNGLSYEARVLLRSLSEVLDLIEFFNHPRCTAKTLKDWVGGDIVANRVVREKATSMAIGGAVYEIADEYRDMPGTQDIIRTLRGKLYRALSGPVHHSLDSLLRAARDREIDSDNSKLAAHFNDELIRSCEYFLIYCGDALPDQHRKALGDATKLLKGTLEDDIPKLIPEISVTLDPALVWSDDSYSPS